MWDVTTNKSCSLDPCMDVAVSIQFPCVFSCSARGGRRVIFSDTFFSASLIHPSHPFVCGMQKGSSSKSTEVDPRVVELRDVNVRLKTVVAYLKAKHTPESINSSIIEAKRHLNDHTPAFVTSDSASFLGTRHVGSLLKLCDAMEVKAGVGGSREDALTECATLLERKVLLLKEVHGV